MNAYKFQKLNHKEKTVKIITVTFQLKEVIYQRKPKRKRSIFMTNG